MNQEDCFLPCCRAKNTIEPIPAAMYGSSVQKPTKAATPAKVTPAKVEAKAESSSDSSDSSSDEDTKPVKAAPVKAVTPAKAITPAKTAAKAAESSDDDSSDEDEKPVKKAAPQKAAVPAKTAVKEEDSSDSDSEEEKNTKKAEKRKASNEVEEPPKKAKTDTGAVPVGSGTTDIFMGNLSFDISEDSLKEFFSAEGIQVIAVRWAEDPATKKFKGYGWATLASQEQAQQAVDTLQGREVIGRAIRLDLSSSRPARPETNTEPGNTVFLGNCSFDITDEAVKEVLGDCGEIVGIRWQSDKETGQFKGMGFVEFATVEAATKAVAFSGTEICGRATRIEFSAPRAPREGGAGGRGGRGGGRGFGGRGGDRGFGGRGGGRGRGGDRGRGFGGRGRGSSEPSGKRTTFE